MNPRHAPDTGSTGTWATDSGVNGERYANMPWSGVAKALLMTSLKGGPWVAVLCLVLWGVWTYVGRGLDVQDKATAEQAKLTATYREYIETAKKSDAALVDSMVLLTRNFDIQSQRLDHQELLLAELKKGGTEPAREMLGLMKDAMVIMSDVPASRKRTEALLQRIAEKP